MPTFREILIASDTDLVKAFHKVRASSDNDFIKRINGAAAQIGLNHAQLVCALGFNRNVRELTDILELIGFSSYKLLTYRRNELFVTDTYRQLDIDNVIDIYAAQFSDADMERTLQELMPQRLAHIETRLAAAEDPAMMISYKMEVHSIYSGGIATPGFAHTRIDAPIAQLRHKVEEVQMILDNDLIPAGNLFYSDNLLPAEKRCLLESGKITPEMIANRLANPEISEDERQMLEDY